MKVDTRYIMAFLVVNWFLLLVTFPSLHPFLTFGHAPYPLDDLEIRVVRNYDYDSTTLEDYHPNQEPLTEVQAGSRFVINSIVKNQNHTQEHFDYITEVFDRNLTVVYLNIRYGVAVPLGGQIPIDSARTPIILNETGLYLVKVFVWRYTDNTPLAMSHPGVGSVHVRAQ